MASPTASTFPDECFLIAPIGEEGSDVRRRSDGVMTYIVEKAALELGLSTVRADQISSPGQINLQVIEHVIGARAAVADLTGLNPNVFYEMAVRHTAKLPLVIIAEKGTDLPFDIAQMRTIFFTHTDLQEADECRQQIVRYLREALENDVVDSPISTAVDLNVLASGGAADRSIAELVTTVEGLSRAQRDMQMMIEIQSSRTEQVPAGLIEELFQASTDLRDFVLGDREKDIDRISRDILDAADYLARRTNYVPSRTSRLRRASRGKTQEDAESD